MLQKYFSNKSLIIFNLSLFIFLNSAFSQNYKLKVHINDATEPLIGASLLINKKQIGNSNSTGNFEGSVSLGDTLMIQYPFYEVYTKILSDTLNQNITLHPKVYQLNDVNITFDKRKVIDSILNLSFSRLKFDTDSKQAFLRQSITKNNKKTVLLNEGLLIFNCPPMNELIIPLEGYKKININIESSCNLISNSENKLIFKSNPQVKLRRGYIPSYFYQEIIAHINKESLKSDSSNIFISISGYLPKFKIMTTYIYTIDSRTNTLKQIQYYEEEDNRKDLFFITFNYSDNELKSVYASAKQERLGNHYSTNDELIIGETVKKSMLKNNFKPNKYGLENYLKENDNCNSVNDYKKTNFIPVYF